MSIYIPFVAISLVAIGIVVFLVIWKLRNSGYIHQDTDYRAFFWIGLLMIIGSIPSVLLVEGYSFSGVFAIGIIFFAMGLANKDKWGKKRKLTPEAVRNKLIALFAAVVLVLAGIFAFTLFL